MEEHIAPVQPDVDGTHTKRQLHTSTVVNTGKCEVTDPYRHPESHPSVNLTRNRSHLNVGKRIFNEIDLRYDSGHHFYENWRVCYNVNSGRLV